MAGSPLVVYYVTAHGFGHATRAAAVIAELERRGARVVVRTAVPAWLFADEGLAAPVQPFDADVGLLMLDALTVDVGASLSAHEGFLARWEDTVRREAAVLASLNAAVVASDAGALPLEAAARAGRPSVLVSNFSWDWIMEPWAAADPRWEAVRARHAAACAEASLFVRLPLGGDSPACRRRVECPLVVRSPRLSKAEAFAALGLDPADPRPVVAFSFGGIGWDGSALRCEGGLEGYRFIAYVPKPAGLRCGWTQLPKHSPMRHCDVLAAADVVFTKPGYGTFSESLAARVPALVVPRTDFRESALLTESLARLGRMRLIAREDFEAGRWEAGLAALRASGGSWAPLDRSGAAFAARCILEAL
ncbi:MAG: hypothetical protein HY928_14215 [Elusimicrobia bacterium]|nr:hypothetical protein [Elusimicrobiota bacterium]